MASIWTMGEILVEIMRPRPDMELSAVGEFVGPFPSGAPAIFIDTAARLGHSAGIIGGVGADDFGRCVLERLRTDGVDCRYVVELAGRATAVAFVTYFGDGTRKFIYHIDGTPAVAANPLVVEDIAAPDFFHVMGCSLMANDDFAKRIIAVAQSCHRRNSSISFDPNIRSELLGDRSLDEVVGAVMEMCRVLLPGVSELALLGGQANIEENVASLFDRYRLEIIVLKRGSDGCIVYTRDDHFHVPAYSISEVDPTGAGDCFDAGFLCGLLEGKALVDCARIWRLRLAR